MIIKFNVTEEDYINFNIDHFINSESMKTLRIILKYMPIIFFIIMSFKTQDNLDLIISIVSAVIFSVLWIAFYPKIMNKSISKTTLKYMKDGKANDFIGEQSVKLAEDYIEESNAKIESKIKYTAVERISFGHNILYIYIGAVKVILIPFSAFIDKEQRDVFLNTLSQKTGLDVSEISKKLELAK